VNIQLTKRDLDLLGWMNGLGFVTVEQISNRYEISKVTAYARLRKLVASEHLTYEKLLHNAPGHYRATQKGVDMSNSVLPPLKKISFSSYLHDQTVASLSVVLEKHYRAIFIPERTLRQQIGIRKIGHRGHVSDGLLEISDKKIAIEVELNTKGKRRLKDIILHYVRSFEYDEVWYFCGNQEIMNLIQSQSKGHDFVKVFSLSEWL